MPQTYFQEKRRAIGLPAELDSTAFLYIRAYRGVGGDILSDARRRMTEPQRTEASDIFKSERDTEERCLINLDKESLPDDVSILLKEALAKDFTRRATALAKGQIPQPLSGLGVEFMMMRPLDAKGMPVERQKRAFIDCERPVRIDTKETQGLDPKCVQQILSYPAIFQTFIRHGEVDSHLPFLLRGIAGFDSHEETMPAVRQRLLETLHI